MTLAEARAAIDALIAQAAAAEREAIIALLRRGTTCRASRQCG